MRHKYSKWKRSIT